MWKIVCVFTGIVIPGILFFFFAQEVDEVFKLVVFLSQAHIAISIKHPLEIRNLVAEGL